MDLMRCNGLPFVASLPHFYKADAKLVEEVAGLTPSADKHASTLLFEQVDILYYIYIYLNSLTISLSYLALCSLYTIVCSLV